VLSLTQSLTLSRLTLLVHRVLEGEGAATADVEEQLTCVQCDRVPRSWVRQAYPSALPLGKWLADLGRRIAAIRDVCDGVWGIWP